MQLNESNFAQRGLLPLPAASLVIDMRGVNDDEVVERLNIEMTDLASEMKTYNVYHWRYLTDFLSFMRVAPATAFEERDLRQQGKEDVDDQLEFPFEDLEQRGPIGPVHRAASGNSLFFQDDQGEYTSGGMSFDLFEQKIDELKLEIDRIRNNRIAAVADLNKAGIPGRSLRDATVRVIFLTDAEREESLKSAAIYAEHIKNYYRKRERLNHQPLVSTTILCLGNSGEAGPPRKLIEGLMRNDGWDHLDTLILSEDYRDDAALIAGTVQAYIAELLLYVLLIIPPFGVRSAELELKPSDDAEQTQGRRVSLPFNTFIVGLAALEYSARWGRRWLSYGLAQEAAEELTQRPFDEILEKRRIDGSVEVWFNDWRSRVQQSIPDHVPVEVSALEGVLNARRVANPEAHIFTTRRFDPHFGETTVKDLHEYKQNLARTYVAGGSDPTLQESVLRSTPQIVHTLQQRETRTLAERRVSELAALQIEAEQILSRKDFFEGAKGALPRAITQLEAIGKVAADFQKKHEDNPLKKKEELQRRHDKLVQEGDKKIDALKKHRDDWPLFGSYLKLHIPMAALSIALIILAGMTMVLFVFAWLNHVLIANNVSFVSYLDAPVLGLDIPTLELIAWGLITTFAIISVIFARSLFSSSALRVEVIFLASLVASIVFGLAVTASITALSHLASDPISIDFLAALAFVPEYTRFALGIAFALVLFEVLYFSWWLSRLRKEREDIVQTLHKQHEEDIAAVTNYIADDVTLEILKRADLISGDGNLGEYYFRVNRLWQLLEEVVKKTQGQQQLAGKRLLLSQSETQEGLTMANGNTWLNLHIRDEKLETQVLTEGYKLLRNRMVAENEALNEFAEFLLRLIGVEKSVEIGQYFESKQTRVNGEPRRLQILMTSLVATTLRFSVDPLSVNTITPILEQYRSTIEYAHQHMPTLSSLIQILSKKMSQATLRSMAEKNTTSAQRLGLEEYQVDMSTDATATWAQMYWQKKDAAVDEALKPDGVLAQMVRMLDRDYDPRAVMRRLLARTSLFGRSISANTSIDFYLLLAPSTQSHEFRQGLKSLKLPRIIDFPDVERMLLLGVQRYAAEPLFLSDYVTTPSKKAINGHDMRDTALPEKSVAFAHPDLGATNGHSGNNGNDHSSNDIGHSNSAMPLTQALPGSDTAMATSSDTIADEPTTVLNPSKVVDAVPASEPTMPMNSSLFNADVDGENDGDDDQSAQHNTAPLGQSSEDERN